MACEEFEFLAKLLPDKDRVDEDHMQMHAGACERTNHQGIPPSVPRTERRKRQTPMTKAVTSPTPRLTN